MFSPAPKPLESRKNPAVLLMAFISKELMREGSAGGLGEEGSAGFVSGDSLSRESDLVLHLN